MVSGCWLGLQSYVAANTARYSAAGFPANRLAMLSVGWVRRIVTLSASWIGSGTIRISAG